MRSVIEIDGTKFGTLEQFFLHFEERALSSPWGRNLDAFNDVLRGGFGTPEDGFVLIWKNHLISKCRLGQIETVRQLHSRELTCHPANLGWIRTEIARTIAGEGTTIFDWLVEIIRDHGPGGAESEDGVELVLD